MERPLSLLLYATVIFIVFCFAFYYIVFVRKVKRWKESKIPFIPPVLPIGHKFVLDIFKNSIPSLLDRVYRENEDKDLVAFFLGVLPVIFVRDPTLVQKMFVKNSAKTFMTLFTVPEEETELQHNPFFSTDKAQWKTARSTMAPLFAPSRMKGPQFEKFKIQTERLWRYLEKARLGEQPINAKRVTDHFIWDSVFLSNFSEDSNPYRELREVVRQFFEISSRRTLDLYLLLSFPFLQYDGANLFGSLKVVPQKQIDLVRSFIEGKMEQRLEKKAEPGDLIDYFVSVKAKEDVSTRSNSETVLRQITGYTISMLFGGTDTLSHLCFTTVHTLSLHPKHQDRIKREIDDVMKKQNASELTFEVIQDLQFTQQCIYETTRVIPIPVLVMRRCTEDFRIPGTNYSFRKGDIFIIPPHSIHRDPKYFKDPNKFDPERFSPENRTSFPSDAFCSFGFGLRKCPGYKLGVLQVVFFVASLLMKYEIRPRSHLKQITADDFCPLGSSNMPKKELLIDLILRRIQD